MNILIQKSACCLLAVALLFTLAFSFGSPARAQSTSSQQTQINTLLALIAQLQAQIAAKQNSGNLNVLSDASNNSTKISVGDRVQTTSVLKVRSTPSVNGSWVNNVDAFTSGTVQDGPRYADNYTWWLVRHDNGTQGWSAANWFRSIAVPTRTLPGVTLEIEPQAESDEFIAWSEFGDWTSYTYELDWGEGDNSAQTKRSRVVTVCNSAWTCSEPSGQFHQYARTGSYQVKLFALIPNNSGVTVRTLVASESVRVTNVPDSSNRDIPTCRITTDKNSYVLGEEIKVNWTSNNTDYVKFTDFSPKDSFDLPTRQKSDDGDIEVEASVTGRPTIELTAYSDDGNKNTCSKTIEVVGPSVDLRVNGRSVSSYTAQPDENITAQYYPYGEIDSCELVAEYETGEIVYEHDWDRWVDPTEPNNFGRGGYSAISSYSPHDVYGLLKDIEVSCEVDRGRDVTDQIRIQVVNSSERRPYSIEFNGEEMSSGSSALETEVWLACRDAIDSIQYSSPAPQSGDQVDCYWGNERIHTVDSWKG